MAQIIKPKRRHTSGAPTTSDLAEGEIAVNTSDYSIYVRDDANNILRVGGVQTPMNQDLDTNNFSFKNTATPIHGSTGLNIINLETMPKVPSYTTTELIAFTKINPQYCEVGEQYKIYTTGDTDWVAMGSSSVNVGTVFTCTAAAPSGTTGVCDLGENYFGMMAYSTTNNAIMGYRLYNWQTM
jgi:hypothetical protein